MCLICVEFNKNKMTREEMLKALPEMIMFSNTEEDKKHFLNLKNLEGEELKKEIDNNLKIKKK